MVRVNVPHVISDDSALGGNLISGSLRFNRSNGSYLSRTFSGSTYDKQKKWTWSAWVKFGSVHQGTLFSGSPNCGGSRSCLYYENGQFITDVCGVGAYDQSDGRYRDTNGWYHIVWRFDTTNATAADRSRVYVNGTEISMSHPRTWSQNVGYGIGKNELHTIGVFSNSTGNYPLDANMAEVHFISELSLDPSHFGYTDSQTGTWRPKRYTGAYNTTGFYLPLDGSHQIGKDMSGNGCDWTPINLTGTVLLSKASGALPILNTNSGGTVAFPGLRSDPLASSIIFATTFSDSSVVATDVHHLVKGSGSAKSITISGAVNSNAHDNFYGRSGSVYFDGSNDYMTVPDNDDWNYGSGDFCIECWVKPTNLSGSRRIISHDENDDNPDSSWIFRTDGDKLNFYFQCNGSSSRIYLNNGVRPLSTNQWYHVAVTRQGSTFRTFINGLIDQTGTFSGTMLNITDAVQIGRRANGSEFWSGYMQDLRVYKGVAKYTEEFLCGAVDPSVLEDSPSGIAISRKLDTPIGGSMGSSVVSNSMILASNSDLFLNGDFTIEFWIYLNSIATETHNPSILTFPTNSGIGQVYISASNKFYSLYWPSSDIVHSGVNSAKVGQWQYVTITRSSNSCRMFIDGVLKNTATSSQNFGNAYGGFRISGYTQTTGQVDGHISNLRIIKGTALYTSSFTPPTEPLTNVTNTKLLCFQSPTDVEALTVDPNTSGLNNKNWTDSGTFSWSIGADSNVTNKGRLFDGTVETGSPGAPNGNPGNVRFTFSSPITGITKCRLRTNTHDDPYQYRRTYYNGANGTYSIQTGSNTTAWHDVSSNVGNTLNWVEWGSYGGADADRGPYGLNGIEINDVLLTDKFRDNDGHGDTCSASNFSPFNNDVLHEGPSQYATLNANAQVGVTLSNGGLTNTGGNDIPSNMGVKTGKFYAEIKIETAYGSPNLKHLGVCATGTKTFRHSNNDSHIISNLDAVMIRSDANGPYSYNGNGAITSWTQIFSDTDDVFTLGDTVGIQLDMDNKFVKFFINGNLRTHYTFITTSAFDKMYFFGRNNGSGITTWNFGQKPFQYTPPSGFLPLASHNLESASIIRPQKHFGIVLWSGNATSSNRAISGLEFKPDLVWTKTRNHAYHHVWMDSVRGPSNRLNSDQSFQENNTNGGYLASFDEGGFTWQHGGGSGNVWWNESGKNYIAWCWKAGGTAVTNNDGSIASQVSANQEAGFSIVTFTGTGSAGTIGHGLGKAPAWVITKRRNAAQAWFTHHVRLNNGHYLRLNDTNAQGGDTNVYPNNMSTTNTFAVGGDDGVNGNGSTYVSYCWAEIPGYSKMGSYTGNASTNGPYIDCGFKPAVIIVKRTNDGKSWWMIDNKRNTYNPSGNNIHPNLENTEGTGYDVDFYNNGFKLRVNGLTTNANGGTFVYIAFADQPEVTPFGSQSNAR